MGPEPATAASDADLVAAQQGDSAAFERVYRAVQPGLLRYAALLSGGDAEDICAETWLQACRDLSRFRGDLAQFRGWIARIARNRVIDAARSRQRRPVDSVPGDELLDLVSSQTASAEAGAFESLATRRALALISGLPRDQAEAVFLRVVLGLDATSAARVVGKRAGAVRTAAYRGLRTLQETLRKDESPPGESAGDDVASASPHG